MRKPLHVLFDAAFAVLTLSAFKHILKDLQDCLSSSDIMPELAHTLLWPFDFIRRLLKMRPLAFF